MQVQTFLALLTGELLLLWNTATTHQWFLNIFSQPVVSLLCFLFSLSFVSLFTNGNMDWREAVSFIAIRCPTPPHRHYWSFQRSSPSPPYQEDVPGWALGYLRPPPFPGTSFLPGQCRQFFVGYTGSPRPSKAEWSKSVDFQEARLTQLAVHHTKNLLKSAHLNKGPHKS